MLQYKVVPELFQSYNCLIMHDPMLCMHTPIMLFMGFMITCYSYVHLCIHLYAIIIAISIAHFNVKNVEMKEKINKNVNIKKIGL